MSNISASVTLKANIADYPVTKALKDGRVESDIVNFEFSGLKSAHDGFKLMLRENAFQVGEIATATYLQARFYKKPFVLIPAATVGKLQHKSVVYNSALGALNPKDIEGKKVGIRAYTQTTGLWARGVLQHSYGVNLDGVTWVTTEDPHLSEYEDPANCERAPEGASLAQMMIEGKLAAAILGQGIPDKPEVVTLIPDASKAAQDWYAKEGVMPVNHMIAIHEDFARARPDVVREIYRMMGESRSFAPEAAAQLPPMGVEANRKALEMAIDLAYEQKIIPRRMSVDELFDDTTGSLN